MRIPVITDLHFGARGDSPIVYAAQEEFYRNIFWPAIDAEGDVNTMLVLGDVTDRRKFLNFQTMAFSKHMFFRPAQERGIKVHWPLGNHDLPFKQSLKLSSYEAYREFDNVVIYRTATPVVVGGLDVLMMPWLCDENVEHSMKMLEEFTGSVVAGHFEFLGFDVYRGVAATHGITTEKFAHFPLVMSGHYHHRSSKGNIHYLGAPYEMIWSDHGEAHGFHWWTPQTHTLEFVPNPHHLFYRFVYNDTDQSPTYVKSLLDEMTRQNVKRKMVRVHIKAKTQPLWYETFVDAAMKLGAHDIQFVDDTNWTMTDVTADTDAGDTLDTLTLIHRYVDGLPWANTDIRTDVTAFMGELYHSAVEQTKTAGRR